MKRKSYQNNISKDHKFKIEKIDDSGDVLLEVKNLTKKIGFTKILDHVSFTIKHQEIVGLIGGNGAGKTTLSEIIAGILPADSGSLKFGMAYKNSFKEKIGMQFQQFEYPSGLSVKDIVSFARNLRKLDFTNNELKKWLKIFRMDNIYRKKINSLSGGEKQKLNILLSVLHEPDLLILDELSTGLDIVAREQIINFVKQLLNRSKASCLLVSHHMSEIRNLCSRIIVLDQGKIVRDQKLKLIKEPLEKYIKKIITSHKSQDLALIGGN